MIRYTPLPRVSVLILDVTVFIPHNVDWVTLDKDGELKTWSNCRKPTLSHLGFWNPSVYDRDVSGERIGDFTRDDDQEFEPLCIEA